MTLAWAPEEKRRHGRPREIWHRTTEEGQSWVLHCRARQQLLHVVAWPRKISGSLPPGTMGKSESKVSFVFLWKSNGWQETSKNNQLQKDVSFLHEQIIYTLKFPVQWFLWEIRLITAQKQMSHVSPVQQDQRLGKVLVRSLFLVVFTVHVTMQLRFYTHLNIGSFSILHFSVRVKQMMEQL